MKQSPFEYKGAWVPVSENISKPSQSDWSEFGTFTVGLPDRRCC
jgi:hypothetical protein